MRRLSSVCAALGAVVVATTLLVAHPAGAQDAQQDTAKVPPINVIEVSGLLDPVQADFIRTAIDRAESQDAQTLVIQLNSRQAVIAGSSAHVAALKVREKALKIASHLLDATESDLEIDGEDVVEAPASKRFDQDQVTARAKGARKGCIPDRAEQHIGIALLVSRKGAHGKIPGELVYAAQLKLPF